MTPLHTDIFFLILTDSAVYFKPWIAGYNPRKAGQTGFIGLDRTLCNHYTIHSCRASSSIDVSFMTSKICSLASRGAHHESPHPAEIDLGTGISLPGTFFSPHTFSIAMASAVV